MTLEKQVCSLELAKRLKELGVKQNGLFEWCEIEEGNDERIPKIPTPHLYYTSEEQASDHAYVVGDKVIGTYSAFTVAELGELIPSGYCYSFQANEFASVNTEKQPWGCEEPPRSVDEEAEVIFFADTEADARAKMVCYLIENGLMKV